MKHVLLAVIIASISTVAMADARVSKATASKVRAALQAWGCTGGKIERESEASGVYEIDDAKCHGGQYDIKLDKNFRVIVITRD